MRDDFGSVQPRMSLIKNAGYLASLPSPISSQLYHQLVYHKLAGMADEAERVNYEQSGVSQIYYSWKNASCHQRFIFTILPTAADHRISRGYRFLKKKFLAVNTTLSIALCIMCIHARPTGRIYSSRHDDTMFHQSPWRAIGFSLRTETKIKVFLNFLFQIYIYNFLTSVKEIVYLCIFNERNIDERKERRNWIFNKSVVDITIPFYLLFRSVFPF